MSKRNSNNKLVRLPVQRRAKKKSNKSKQQEVGLLGRALRGLGGLGGGAVGSLFGAPTTGSSIGTSLGATLSKWLGAGDYTVQKNTIVQRASSSIPMMHNNGQSVTIRHREFITSINGSTDFNVQAQLPINPGLKGTFPWLSGIASRFQEYEIKGMVYHYVPTSGTYNGSNVALGTVMIQTSYRATDAPPPTKAEMLNEYWANEVVPFESMVHPIECDPKENPFAVHYVRNKPIESGEPLMYDMGVTFVATQGMSSTATVGDLWVTYEVELKKPLISSNVVNSVKYFATTFQNPTSTNFFSGTRGADVGTTACTFSTNKITFPKGTAGLYIVQVDIVGVGLTHATQVSWNYPTMSNFTQWEYDGTYTELKTSITGTNPSTNRLTVTGGYGQTDAYTSASLTYPAAQWTSGSTTHCVVQITLITEL